MHAEQVVERIVTLRDVSLLELEVFDAADCAAYLRLSKKHFLDVVATLPTFPKPFRFPVNDRGKAGRSQIRWDAGQVRAWAKTSRMPADETVPNVSHAHASY